MAYCEPWAGTVSAETSLLQVLQAKCLACRAFDCWEKQLICTFSHSREPWRLNITICFMKKTYPRSLHQYSSTETWSKVKKFTEEIHLSWNQLTEKPSFMPACLSILFPSSFFFLFFSFLSDLTCLSFFDPPMFLFCSFPPSLLLFVERALGAKLWFALQEPCK